MLSFFDVYAALNEAASPEDFLSGIGVDWTKFKPQAATPQTPAAAAPIPPSVPQVSPQGSDALADITKKLQQGGMEIAPQGEKAPRPARKLKSQGQLGVDFNPHMGSITKQMQDKGHSLDNQLWKIDKYEDYVAYMRRALMNQGRDPDELITPKDGGKPYSPILSLDKWEAEKELQMGREEDRENAPAEIEPVLPTGAHGAKTEIEDGKTYVYRTQLRAIAKGIGVNPDRDPATMDMIQKIYRAIAGVDGKPVFRAKEPVDAQSFEATLLKICNVDGENVISDETLKKILAGFENCGELTNGEMPDIISVERDEAGKPTFYEPMPEATYKMPDNPIEKKWHDDELARYKSGTSLSGGHNPVDVVGEPPKLALPGEGGPDDETIAFDTKLGNETKAKEAIEGVTALQLAIEDFLDNKLPMMLKAGAVDMVGTVADKLILHADPKAQARKGSMVGGQEAEDGGVMGDANTGSKIATPVADLANMLAHLEPGQRSEAEGQMQQLSKLVSKLKGVAAAASDPKGASPEAIMAAANQEIEPATPEQIAAANRAGEDEEIKRIAGDEISDARGESDAKKRMARSIRLAQKALGRDLSPEDVKHVMAPRTVKQEIPKTWTPDDAAPDRITGLKHKPDVKHAGSAGSRDKLDHLYDIGRRLIGQGEEIPSVITRLKACLKRTGLPAPSDQEIIQNLNASQSKAIQSSQPKAKEEPKRIGSSKEVAKEDEAKKAARAKSILDALSSSRAAAGAEAAKKPPEAPKAAPEPSDEEKAAAEAKKKERDSWESLPIRRKKSEEPKKEHTSWFLGW